MIKLLAVACLFGAALAAPQLAPNQPIAIVSSFDDHNPDGSYQWGYETANGIKAQESGSLKPAQDPKDGQVVVAQGSYSYTADDGSVITLTYVADDVGGFQAQGDHLPTPPPIPEAIKRALDFIASQPQQPQGQPPRRLK
ncbi:endocuticle structural glycoprotein SgAbd-4 [Halyomorpha halys]|uniref:endocuticle structural glycoprotein SgAbd-4 n=1 Tax=Halyomorpha halys TaxID=286706 RepID=UPI0006D4E02E|nr:endocuticle structural glycoprotein SgAbd-4-like [Halyomorpha halys]KAE8573247.1 Cuticle Protein CPR RR-1 [Halyomorpha halys]